MDIALGGLIFLVILLPGISFRKGYFSGEFSNQYSINDFFQLFINTLFPSIITYLAFLPIIFLFGYTYDFEVLLRILSSNDDGVKDSIAKIQAFIYPIILFQIIANLFALGAGNYLKDVVLSDSYDAKNKFLRYNNVWHYLLTAKFTLFERSQISFNEHSIDDVDITFVDALVNTGENPYIYTGILVDYELASDGGLDLIYLKKAQRELLTQKWNNAGIQNINGHIIILKYENIINLNLSFIQVNELKEGDVEIHLLQ